MQLGTLPGISYQSNLKYGFKYETDGIDFTEPGGWPVDVLKKYPVQQRGTTWIRNPPAYPAFAEYSAPAINTGSNVDDTGVLLRAFLPYADAQSRQNLKDYSGKAIVLDSSVSC